MKLVRGTPDAAENPAEQSPQAKVLKALIMQARVLRKGADCRVAEVAARYEQKLQQEMADYLQQPAAA